MKLSLTLNGNQFDAEVNSGDEMAFAEKFLTAWLSAQSNDAAQQAEVDAITSQLKHDVDTEAADVAANTPKP